MIQILALLFGLLVTPAAAQNATCPDRPSGDSSNACANTRFVKSNSATSFGAGVDVGSPPPTYNVQPVVCDGTDQSSRLLALMAAMKTDTKRRLEFRACTYRIDNIEIANDNATHPYQPSWQFVGAGEFWSNYDSSFTPTASLGGTVFDMRGSNSLGRIRTYGFGALQFDNIVFTNLGTSNGNPMMYTTNTTLILNHTVFWGAADRTASTVNEDMIVLGGTATTYGSTNTNDAFQGYGTLINHPHFHLTRRGIIAQSYANGLAIKEPHFAFDTGCGSLTDCGSIELTSPSAAGYIVGGNITGGIFETKNYAYAVKATNVSQFTFNDVNCYDADTPTQACIGIFATGGLTPFGNVVVGGSGPGGVKPYLIDNVGSTGAQAYNSPAGGGAFLATGTALQGYSQFQSITSGVNGYPNLLGPTTFTGGTSSLIIQPTPTTGAGKPFLVKRSAAEASGPGAEVQAFATDGTIYCNAGANAAVTGCGNFTNGSTGGASWTSQGKVWLANGAGGTMEIGSGSGGSNLKLSNNAVQFYQQDRSTFVGAVGPLFGGSGLAGIGFGTLSPGDVAMYRLGAGIIGFTGVTVASSYTVATLPGTPSVGMYATVTDGSAALAWGANIAGGGTTKYLVWYNGANWTVVAK